MLDLLRAAPLIDGHNDLLWELRQDRDPADPTLMTDLPRMAAGGVGGQFWSVYVPSDLPADRAVTMTLEQIDALLDMVRRNPDGLELSTCAVAIDYIVRFSIAPRKGHFLTHHKLDLVVVAVPFAQPLRLIRSVRVLRVFRAGRATAYLGKGIQEGRSLLSRENFGFAILMAGLAILGGAALVYGLEESDPNGTIKSMPDAIWWAITTVSTVGSDKYPVTAEGRAIAVILMVVGIGLVGLLAGTMASFFVEEQHKRQLAELLRKMEAIEMQLAKQNGPGLRSENGQTGNEDLAPVAPLGPSDRGR